MSGIKRIRQQDRYDCGAACLASVASWYGSDVPLAQIRQLCGCSREGTAIGGILAGAQTLGFNAKAYKSEDKNPGPLKKLAFPVIAHIRQEDGFFHYITLYKTRKNDLTVMDPAGGEIKKISWEQFGKEWTGYIILAVPGDNFIKRNDKISLTGRLVCLLHFHKKELFLSLAGSAAVVTVGVGNSIFLQQIIDKALPSGNAGLLIFISAVIFILLFFTLYIGYARILFLIRCGIKMDAQLILSYLKKLFRLPAASLRLYSPGDLNARLGDAFKIRAFISDGLIGIFISVFTFAAALIGMFAYNFRLAALAMLFIPLYTGLYFLSGRLNKKYNRQLAVTGARFESRLLETLRGVPVIKHYGAEPFTYGKIENTYSELTRKMYRAGRALATFGIVGEGITRCLSATVLVAGGFAVLNLEMTTGELVSFYTLVSFLTAPLNHLGELNNSIAQAVISSERLFEILDMQEEENYRRIEPETELSTNQAPGGGIWSSLLEATREIRLENISFAYPGRNPLFENLSLSIPAGKITAVTGESGCGKSTFVSLLMQDLAPQTGKIFLENADIKTIGLARWRNYVCLVSQQPYLFSGTVLENITCGAPGADGRAVLELCINLGMGELIQKLPDGLLTRIGGPQQILSGGEIQRIAFARAVYKNPKILILDEATCSLDKISERIVYRRVERMREEGKTILLITHKKPEYLPVDAVIKLCKS